MATRTNLAAMLCTLIVLCSGTSLMAQHNQAGVSQEHKQLMNTVLKNKSPYAQETTGTKRVVSQKVPRTLPRTMQVKPLSYSQPRYQGNPQIIKGDSSNPNAPSTHGYPYLNAPLYPTTQPNILHQTGSTMITNQALNPHEMLYPHKYHAMYGPFYYKVNGHWATLPWGIWSSENWRLQGTHVNVNYRSKRRFLSGFHPPSIR